MAKQRSRSKTKQQLTPKQMAVVLLLCVAAAAVRWYLQPEPVSLEDIPAYGGAPYVELEGNEPGFTKEEMTLEVFEEYSELDALGRCGVAYANICPELMPTEERESIGNVKPTGWISAKYDCVDGKYLYNRCHLIGFQLAGENANECNLITGTRYLNVTGMLPFENEVADYVQRTDNHVLYRVTPVFVGSELVARGVQMEAYSVEDAGEGVCFNVFAYNVQPGVGIDYATGESWLEEDAA
ncbi:DNA/RNA non-specific endonuclease [uncultured Oscillibacter sp.]|uniref:DNA/RNA non-specific endonuclease n=1 Tax=uncultured Oscillibacter sp. TaxID=876091 RepID=UPI003418016D